MALTTKRLKTSGLEYTHLLYKVKVFLIMKYLVKIATSIMAPEAKPLKDLR